MFNEGLKSSAFINKTLYIDTPIIFRLLGYYGNFYEQEYKFLIQSLIEKNCKIYIFKRNYDEVLKVCVQPKNMLRAFNMIWLALQTFAIILEVKICAPKMLPKK